MTDFQPEQSNKRQSYSRFFLWMGLTVLICVVIGFSRTWFFQRWSGAPALSISLHLHGLAAFTWILIFLLQAVLIDRKLVRYHRHLGVFGFAVAILLVISSIYVSINITKSHGGTPESVHRLGLVFFVALSFFLLVCIGIWFRQNPAVHKRFMCLATVQVATPAIGRFPVPDQFLIPFALSVILLLLVSVIFYDLKTTKRIHVATIVGITIVVLSLPGRQMIGSTEWWTRIANQILN